MTTAVSFSTQLDVLINRTLSTLTGSVSNVMILLIQPPLIGYFIGLGWEGNEAQKTTYFVMAIAAMWLGCMNACTTIVKERAILERERMFNISLWAYLLSKLAVLSVIVVVQMLLLLWVQCQFMHLPGGWGAIGGNFLFLCLTALSATGLGLLISACSPSNYIAVMAVPILLIPQVIFSEMILQNQILRDLPSTLEKLTLTKWGYDAMESLSKVSESLDWGVLSGSAGVLLAQMSLFVVLAWLKLRLS